MDRKVGMALPLVLVLLLALTALGHGSLLLAQRELQASAGYRRLVQARRLAEGGVAMARARLQAALAPGMGDSTKVLAEGELVEGGWYRGTLVPLGSELFLLEGRGGVGEGRGEARVGWLGWHLDPVARMAAMSAVVEVGGGTGGVELARIEAGDMGRIPEGWDGSACAMWTPVTDTLFPSSYLPPLGPLGSGPPDSGPGRAIPSLGRLTGTMLLDLGEPLSGPSPSHGSGCPGQAGSGVLHAEAGSLTLRGGERCGLLVVGGDLRLTEGHRFQGFLLVAGDLEIEDGAKLEGMARVGGVLRIREGGEVVGCACAALRAVGETPALRNPLPLPEGSVLRPY